MGRDQARLRSPEALARVRAALIKFSEEVAGALDEADAQIGRGQQWLTREQPTRWKHAHRKAADFVNSRRSDVYRKQMQGVDRPNSAIEEKKQLEQAKRKMAEAEHVLRSLKSWTTQLEKAAMLYRGQSQRLRSFVTVDAPNAVAALDSMAASIEGYLSEQAPTAETAPMGTAQAGGAAMAQGSAAARPRADGTGSPDFDQLRARTPDDSERFDLPNAALPDEPVEGDPGVLRPLLASLVNVDRDDAGAEETVVVERAALETDRVYAERIDSATADDSGWFVGDGRVPRPAKSDDSLGAADVAGVAAWLPGLGALIDLPAGWLVVFDRGTVVAVARPDGSVAWTAGGGTSADGGADNAGGSAAGGGS